MKRRPKKPELTETELDELVIADAQDPSAWGEPVTVPPSKSKRPAWIARAKEAAERVPDSVEPARRR
ncbi:MAG TPA: hypothetical protein VGF28_07510 [Thermoanaerobaculia bacterium]